MCCKDYFATLFAAYFSIVQSCFHIGFCAWGTNAYLCKNSIETGTFRYLLYLTYFYTNSCTNVSSSDLPFERSSRNRFFHWIPVQRSEQQNFSIQREKRDDDLPDLQFPTEAWAAERTFNIMKGFIIVDSLWLIAAIALLIGSYFQVKQFLSMLFYFPWICILLILLFFDAVASVWFGMDIPSTYGLKNWFIFIGGAQQDGLPELAKRYIGPFTSVPSIIMLIIFSRLFIIWFINLFLLFRITQVAINAFDDFDDESSITSSKSNNVDVVTSITVDNKICSRNFQVRHINPILLDVRRRRSQIQYGSDDDDDNDVQTIRKYKKKMKTHKQTIDEIQSCSNFESDRKTKKLSNLHKQEQVYDNNYLKVVIGYEGDRSRSPSPVHNRQQNFNFSSKYTPSYVIEISKSVPT